MIATEAGCFLHAGWTKIDFTLLDAAERGVHGSDSETTHGTEYCDRIFWQNIVTEYCDIITFVFDSFFSV